jgi:hypothetical protein
VEVAEGSRGPGTVAPVRGLRPHISFPPARVDRLIGFRKIATHQIIRPAPSEPQAIVNLRDRRDM